MKYKIALLLTLAFLGCANLKPGSGESQIQKKCHSVDGLLDEWVCEQP